MPLQPKGGRGNIKTEAKSYFNFFVGSDRFWLGSDLSLAKRNKTMNNKSFTGTLILGAILVLFLSCSGSKLLNQELHFTKKENDGNHFLKLKIDGSGAVTGTAGYQCCETYDADSWEGTITGKLSGDSLIDATYRYKSEGSSYEKPVRIMLFNDYAIFDEEDERPLKLYLTKPGTADLSINIAMKNELEKWKTELLLNGEVGPPCIKDYNKWAQDNPSYYFGIQPIDTLAYDINGDYLEDALFYFPAVNCVGGNGSASDFALLVYSNDTEYLTTKNLSATIEARIRHEYANRGVYDIANTIVRYKELNGKIMGNYISWLDGDSTCCPTYSGEYEYDPVSFKIEITANKNAE